MQMFKNPSAAEAVKPTGPVSSLEQLKCRGRSFTDHSELSERRHMHEHIRFTRINTRPWSA
jgi:hypothetical protein